MNLMTTRNPRAAVAAAVGLPVLAITPAMNDRTLRLGDIFRGAFAFVMTMLLCLVILALFPGIATWLARP